MTNMRQECEEILRQILEIIEDPVMHEAGYAGQTLEVLQHQLESGKEWLEQRRLKAMGAINMPSGSVLTRPGMTVINVRSWVPSYSPKAVEMDWTKVIDLYRVELLDGQVVAAQVPHLYAEPDEDAERVVVKELDTRLATERGLFKNRGALMPLEYLYEEPMRQLEQAAKEAQANE